VRATSSTCPAPSQIAGNWKLNHHRAAALALVDELKAALKAQPAKVDVIVAPVFPYLPVVASALARSNIGLAGQDCCTQASGAFTGEVSASMLVDVGCSHVIVGHSERRAMFGDTDALVGDKTRAALEAGLTPIVCCGETLAERDANTTLAVVERQLKAVFEKVAAHGVEKIIIAYEPVWAIGTGRVATPAQAQEVHAGIRRLLAATFGEAAAQAVTVLYGGSVKADNIAALLAEPDVDGGLVGGASLKAADFLGIIRGADAALG
jgi:triosephosphate isomerase